jgi:hemerythrin superfamily protein
MDPTMNVFELLKVDHAAVKLRFTLLHDASMDSSRRRSLFEEIKDALLVHAMLEEHYFYPLLEKASETELATRAGLKELELLKQLLTDLDRVDESTETWREKLRVLEEHVEHHVREEEGELFPRARMVIGREQATTLGEMLEEEREKALLMLPERAGATCSLFSRSQGGRDWYE